MLIITRFLDMNDLIERFDSILALQRKTIDSYEKQIENYKLNPLPKPELAPPIETSPPIDSWTPQKAYEANGNPEKWAQLMALVKEQYS